MTNRVLKYASSALACVLAAGLSARAVPTLYAPETFPVDGDTEGWTVSGDPGISEGTLGGEQALIITFSPQGFPFYEDGVVMAGSGASGDRFRGDYMPYTPDVVAQFKFFAETVQPSGLALYMHGLTSGRTWVYNLTLPAIGEWVQYGVPMGGLGAWQREDLTPALAGDFLADLADVDWIGLFIARNPSTAEQNYGLDDVQLAVPEPQTICLLLAAFMSLAFTFRSKVGSVFAGVKGMVRAA